MGDVTAGETLARIRTLIVTDSRDWALDRSDAALYALLVGWECEAGCAEQDDPDHACDGALLEVAERHGWSVVGIEQIRQRRAAIRAITR